MTSDFRGTAATALTLTILVALLVLGGWIGNWAAYIAMFGSVLGLLLVWDRQAYLDVLATPWLTMIIAAFLLLAVAIVANSPTLDLRLHVVDFLPLVLVVPTAVVFSRARVRNGATLISTLALVGALVAAVVAAHANLTTGTSRAGGLEISPIHFGDIAIIFGFMSLGGLMVGTHPWRMIYLFGPVFGIGAALLSGTRATLFVGIALIGVTIYFAVRHSGRQGRLLLLALALGALAVASSYVALREKTTDRLLGSFTIVTEMITGTHIADASFRNRVEMWEGGVKAFWEAPITGHGWTRQLQAALPHMSDSARATYRRQHWGYIHNEALSLGVGMGALGIIAYFLLMLHPLVQMSATPPDSQSLARNFLLVVVFVGIFVSGLTDVLFKTELLKTFFCFLPAAIALLCRDRGSGLLHDIRTTQTS
jgi:O-antigen ligase